MRILLISRLYPPAEGAQSFQVSRIVQALRSCGEEVTVLAGIADADQVPAERESDKFIVYSTYQHLPRPVRSVLRICESEVLATLPVTRWTARAIGAGIDLVRKVRPDVILSCSHSYHAHIVGLALKNATGLPWVASFSDPPASLLPKPYGRKIFRMLRAPQCRSLREVFQSCDQVVVASHYALDLYESELNVTVRQKATVIPHIARVSDNSDAPARRTLVHVGSITRERVSGEVLSAVKSVEVESPGRFYGLDCIGDVAPEFRGLVRKLDASECVRVYPRQDEHVVPRILTSSFALLLVEASMPVSPFLPSKFCEYAASGRPIIAVTPEVSAVRDYIRKFSLGFAVENNRDAIKTAIRSVFCSTEGRTAAPLQVFSPSVVATSYRKLFRQLTTS
jgi:glycosyltransferase involved in cell wall biosynthesis